MAGIWSRSVTISPEAIHCLEQYPFPGNARELRNLIERALVLCRGTVISPIDLPVEICWQTALDESRYHLATQVIATAQIILLFHR